MGKRYTEYLDGLSPLDLMVSYEDGNLVDNIEYIFAHQGNTDNQGSHILKLYDGQMIKLDYKVGPFTVEYINEEPKEEQLLEFTRTETNTTEGYIITENFSY